MGYKGYKGLVGFAHTLANLRELRYLHLGHTNLGLGGAGGLIRNLKYSQGVAEIGKSLAHLHAIEELYLEHARIGYHSSIGAQNIGLAFQNMTRLKRLKLNSNAMGFRQGNGTLALGQYLKHLRGLEWFNWEGNVIGLYEQKASSLIIESIFELMKTNPSLSFQITGMINRDWGQQSRLTTKLLEDTVKQQCESAKCHNIKIHGASLKEGSADRRRRSPEFATAPKENRKRSENEGVDYANVDAFWVPENMLQESLPLPMITSAASHPHASSWAHPRTVAGVVALGSLAYHGLSALSDWWASNTRHSVEEPEKKLPANDNVAASADSPKPQASLKRQNARLRKEFAPQIKAKLNKARRGLHNLRSLGTPRYVVNTMLDACLMLREKVTELKAKSVQTQGAWENLLQEATEILAEIRADLQSTASAVA
jgi:hypothetical protein